MGQVNLAIRLSHLSRLFKRRLRASEFSGLRWLGEGVPTEEVTSGAWLVCHADPGVLYMRDPDGNVGEVIRSMGIEPVQLMHGRGSHDPLGLV